METGIQLNTFVNQLDQEQLSPCGGFGRHGVLGTCAYSVGVRVPPWAPTQKDTDE